MPPRESVIQSASRIAGSAATDSERTSRIRPALANQQSSTIAPAIAAASPFQ